MNTIFITGASSGIGKATAKLFAEKGWTVIATMRTPENESELTSYDNIQLYPLDVTKPEQIAETVTTVLEKYEVDVLFNNVGYGMKSPLEDLPEDIIWKSLDTNFVGMVRVTQKFIPYFKRRKSGLILTTTSLAGEIGLILDGVYAAEKWALTGLSEMLYFELAPFNIQVKILVPGVVRTNFKSEILPAEGYDSMVKRQMEMLMPDMECIETAEEAAIDVWNAVTDQDKDRMCYVTGKEANQLYEKRQKLGDEEFRKYYKSELLK